LNDQQVTVDIASLMSMYSIYDITKCDFGFPYSQLEKWFTQSEIARYCQNFRRQVAIVTKQWDKQKNAEWVARHYLSIKMILSASVMISSAEYSRTKNIRITEPYLYYYSVLSCCRALIYTLPRIHWKSASIIGMTHQKILNINIDTIKVISRNRENYIKDFFNFMKSMRELFSYKFPALGLRALNRYEYYEIETIIKICSLLCELAQLHSELMQDSISRNVKGDFELEEADLKLCFEYDINGNKYIDQDDWYRINYMTRKMKMPYNLHWMMTEGLVEDFFGAWIPDEEEGETDAYNADDYWSLIYPAP
jgi:hypothetical protein